VGEYLLFLNNDIEVLKPPVTYLCALAGEGISGPGPLLTETHEICIEGWALCLKKTTLTAIGNWCENYGAGYWDDVDLCYRAVLKGYPLHHSSEFLSGNWQAPGRDQFRASAYIYHLGGTTGTDGRLEKQILNERNRQLFTQKFYPQLREINAIVFPDWQQPEDIFYAELAQVIRAVQSHPAYDRLSLIVDSGALSDEDADLILSGILMNLLLETDLEADTEPSISILTQFQRHYWLPWRYRLHFRLMLPHENESAIADRAADLPALSIQAFLQG
jgi:hypothetical protein